MAKPSIDLADCGAYAVITLYKPLLGMAALAQLREVLQSIVYCRGERSGVK